MRHIHRTARRAPTPRSVQDPEEVVVVDWDGPLPPDPGATLVEATATLVDEAVPEEATDATESDLPAFVVARRSPEDPASLALGTPPARAFRVRRIDALLLALDLVLVATLVVHVRELKVRRELARRTHAGPVVSVPQSRPPAPPRRLTPTAVRPAPIEVQVLVPSRPSSTPVVVEPPRPVRTASDPPSVPSNPPVTSPVEPSSLAPIAPLPPNPVPPPVSVADVVRAAHRALLARDFDGALAGYERALALDPGHAEARTGVLRARGERAAVGRLFLTLPTVRQSRSSCNPFERGAKCASRRELDCKIEFALTPAAPGQGDTYTVEVFALNTGERKLEVESADAVTSANGSRVAARLAARAVDIPRGERRLLGRLTGVWELGTTSWRLEASVTDQEGDRYRAELAWEPRPSR